MPHVLLGNDMVGTSRASDDWKQRGRWMDGELGLLTECMVRLIDFFEERAMMTTSSFPPDEPKLRPNHFTSACSQVKANEAQEKEETESSAASQHDEAYVTQILPSSTEADLAAVLCLLASIAAFDTKRRMCVVRGTFPSLPVLASPRG